MNCCNPIAPSWLLGGGGEREGGILGSPFFGFLPNVGICSWIPSNPFPNSLWPQHGSPSNHGNVVCQTPRLGPTFQPEFLFSEPRRSLGLQESSSEANCSDLVLLDHLGSQNRPAGIWLPCRCCSSQSVGSWSLLDSVSLQLFGLSCLPQAVAGLHSRSSLSWGCRRPFIPPLWICWGQNRVPT